jgi:hypothetical protein
MEQVENRLPGIKDKVEELDQSHKEKTLRKYKQNI